MSGAGLSREPDETWCDALLRRAVDSQTSARAFAAYTRRRLRQSEEEAALHAAIECGIADMEDE